MARSQQKQRHDLRDFLILVAVVVIGGLILWSQGDLINPLESTVMLISMSSAGNGSTAVGGASPAEAAAPASRDDSGAPESPAAAETASDQAGASGTMTLEAFTAALAAAGVDVDAVSADLSAQGRNLESLLSVVNSGRVTVAELAARLKSTSATETPAPTPEANTDLLEMHWDEFGSVVYDLWFILAVTVAVIVIARPAGWLVNHLKGARQTGAR